MEMGRESDGIPAARINSTNRCEPAPVQPGIFGELSKTGKLAECGNNTRTSSGRAKQSRGPRTANADGAQYRRQAPRDIGKKLGMAKLYRHSSGSPTRFLTQRPVATGTMFSLESSSNRSQIAEKCSKALQS